MKELLKLILLGILIIIALGILWYRKSTKEGFQVSPSGDGMPQDSENPLLTPAQYYGDIPQAASISIFQNAEIRALTANPDSIPISDGDAKTGAGAGPQLTLTDIPAQPVPSDDIEAILNGAAYTTGSVKEGFRGGVGAVQAQAKAMADAKAKEAATQAAINKGLPITAAGVLGIPMTAGIPSGNPNTVQGQIQNAAEGKAQELTQQGVDKLKDLVKNRLKTTKLAASAEKTAAKAKTVAVKLGKKVVQKLQGVFATKVGAKIGAKATEGIFKKMIVKASEKISVKAGAALAAGSALSSNPLTLAFGIMMNVIAAVGLALGVALPLQFKDQGVCSPGYSRVSEAWPSYLDMIPGLGDIMGAMAPYMCYTNACEPGEQEDAGLCYPPCEGGYEGVGPMCWARNVNIGVGVLQGCGPGWHDDGALLCQQPSGQICGDNCAAGWDGCKYHTSIGCIGGCRTTCAEIYADASKWIGKMNKDSRLACPGDHPEYIDGLCYAKCPSLGGNPYQKTTNYPIWIKVRSFPNRDAAQAALDAEKAKNNNANADTIKKLTNALGDAIRKDYSTLIPTSSLYVRNPEGPRTEEEKNIPDKPTVTLPQYVPAEIIFPSFEGGMFAPMRIKPGTGIIKQVPNPDYANQLENYNAKKATFDTKYPVPSPTTLDSDIPTLSETVTVDPRTPLNHVPGMPYQCVGSRGIAFGRGVGKPKLKLKMAGPTPPTPPPPPAYTSAAYANDPSTKCVCDFSNTTVLQEMADFYYNAAISNPLVNVDGSMSVSYVTKIISVIGSSEQSADVMCEVTTVVFNPNTGQIISSTVAPTADRRFYFAKIASACRFIVVGATNINKTALCVTASGAESRVVNFVPVIVHCANVPITLAKCTMESSVTAMMSMYTQNLSSNVRIKSVDAIENTGPSTCTVRWTEAGYDPLTNVETAAASKVGNFTYSQDKSNDACFFTLQGYAPGDTTRPVKAAEKPIIYPTPLPPEKQLQGCSINCKDPSILPKLISSFNSSTNPNKILSLTKVTTASELRCDVEAEVFIKDTKTTEKQRIRFDMTKDPGGCVFKVATVGAAGSGTFIQNNTVPLTSMVTTKDSLKVMDGLNAAMQGIANSSMKITNSRSLVDSIYQTFFAAFGQSETLSSGCSAKCSDPAILDSIINTYNKANYPLGRTNVTKKTMTRILKAGTAGVNSCDILFEEKKETYADMYLTAPTTVITQKTERFVVKDTGDCTFTVDLSGVAIYGLAGVAPTDTTVLPELSIPDETVATTTTTTSEEGFQTMPTVINEKTPNLAPPYKGKPCNLDCADRSLLEAVNQAYQPGSTEGFAGWFSNLSEAFQDTLPATLHTVNKSIQLGLNACEYEIIDSNGDTGYYRARFDEDASSCSFTPNSVQVSTSPIIPGLPAKNTTQIGYSFSGTS
jgi:hypothetical protein